MTASETEKQGNTACAAGPAVVRRHAAVRESGGRVRHALTAAVLCLALAMPGPGGTAHAVEFKISGEWLVGFGGGSGKLLSHYREPGSDQRRHKLNSDDTFGAAQRFRIQLEAVASEALSGAVFLEIGDQQWGKAEDGAALGADGTTVIKLRNAYIDWQVPDTSLNVRMGIQAFALPNAAGGSAIMDGDAAGVAASYAFNDAVSLTALWMRPVNDNYTTATGAAPNRQGWLDNMDLFALSLPVTLDGVQLTPWLMYGMLGKNALQGLDAENFEEPWETSDGILGLTIPGLTPGFNYADPAVTPLSHSSTGKAYGSMFWAGLPIVITAADPWHFELDINYGFVEGMGRYDVIKRGNPDDVVRGSTRRQGWLVKALAEYTFDWGAPGIFGWYASGDDGSVRNGSERMPSIAGAGNFTSFIGDGNLAWGSFPDSCDWAMTYSGTWGVGLQLRDLSFVEGLSHTVRAALWGGTNSTSMVKYMKDATAWSEGYGGDGPYLTTNDNLLEFNLVNQYQIYENLEINLELGYVVNMMDKDTWVRKGYAQGEGNGGFSKQDAWKAQLIVAYTF